MMAAAADLSTIGGRLRAERQRLRMTQPAFAALAGASKGAQLKWEKGQAWPNATALAAFAVAGADICYIVTGKVVRASAAACIGNPATSALAIREVLAGLSKSDRSTVLLAVSLDELAR